MIVIAVLMYLVILGASKNKTAEEPTKAPQTQVVQEKSYSKKEVDSLMLKTKYEAEQKAKALVKKDWEWKAEKLP